MDTHYFLCQKSLALLIKSTILVLLLTLSTSIAGWGQTSVTYTATGSSTWNTPAGVTGVTVEAWGGGGAGGGVDGAFMTRTAGGGGGAGAFQRGYSSTPNASYTVVVGTGGTPGAAGANKGNNGANSTFGSTLVVANGGTGGDWANSSFQDAYATSGATGTYNGGGGRAGNYNSSYSGGGGGGAGNTGNGNTATTVTGGNGGTGGGGKGGNGFTGTGSGSGSNGGAAVGLSGGGGGAYAHKNTNYSGGAGFRGQVVIYYYLITGVTATTPICIGSTSTVTISGTATNLPTGTYTVTYNLSGSNTATDLTATMIITVAGSGTITVPSASLTTSGTTTVTITKLTKGNYSGGIGANNTANIVVNTIPTASAGGNQTICVGNDATISGASSSNGTILWTHNGSGSLSNATSLTPTYTSVAGDAGNTVTLTMTVSNSPCTAATASYTVYVRALPTASAGGNQTICAGSDATVSGASSSNGTILWSHNGSGSLSNTTTLTPTYTSIEGDAGNTVTLTMTVSNSPCTAATASYTVAVEAQPTASAGGSQTICVGSDATVSGASSSNGTILWSHNGSGTLANATTLTPTYSSVAGDAGNTVTLTMTVSNSPCTATANYTVYVNAMPTASASGSTNNCLGGASVVSGASSSNGTILWTENGAGSITADAATLTPTYTSAVGDAGSTVTLTMTVSNSPCTAATANYSIIVNVQPTSPTTSTLSPGGVYNIAVPVNVCVGRELTLDVAASGGDEGYGCEIEYRYTTGWGPTWSAPQTTIPVFNAISGDNFVQARRANCTSGCDNSGWNTVAKWVAHNQPSATMDQGDFTSSCPNDIVELTFSALGGTGGVTFIWQTSSSLTPASWSDIGNGSVDYYTAPTSVIGTTYYRGSYKSTGFGCIQAYSDPVEVTVQAFPSSASLQDEDYVWIGNITNVWATPDNWRQWDNSTSTFSIPLNAPTSASNVFIRDVASCVDAVNIITTDDNTTSLDLTIDNGFAVNLGVGYQLNVKGDFTNNGSFNSNTGNLLFSGSTPQSIKTNSFSIYDVEFANTSGSNAAISLIDNFTVTNSATFTSGIVNTGVNKFILTSAATTNSSSPASFIDGLVERVGSGSFTLPCGDVNNRNIGGGNQSYIVFAPITISPVANTTTTVEYFFSNSGLPNWWNTGSNLDATLHHVTDREYWIVNSTENFSNVTLNWNTNSHADGNVCTHSLCDGDNIYTALDLSVAYWTGTLWRNAGGAAVGGHDAGSITSGLTIPFGTKTQTIITFGSKNNLNPLPIELTKFYAHCNNNSAIITWQTASETNNSHFVIEKSNDMANFIEIARVDGAGISNMPLSYSISDNELFIGNNYYRLKQVDFDGIITTYDPISVNCDKQSGNNSTMIAYPNPFTEELNIVIEDLHDNIFVIELYDELGRLVITKKCYSEDYDSQTTLDLKGLRPGVYNLRSKSVGHIMNMKVVKN